MVDTHTASSHKLQAARSIPREDMILLDVSGHDPVGEPLVVIELPLPVVVVALSDKVQAKGHRFALVQVWHQPFAGRTEEGQSRTDGRVVSNPTAVVAQATPPASLIST